MTLQGLTGTLGDLNANLQDVPTAGAYCSLDPGTGPDADYTWISTNRHVRTKCNNIWYSMYWNES